MKLLLVKGTTLKFGNLDVVLLDDTYVDVPSASSSLEVAFALFEAEQASESISDEQMGRRC